jgi:NAD-dependent deacetylase
VYPASGLITAYQGNRLALINKSPTPRDKEANLIIREPIGQVLAAL